MGLFDLRHRFLLVADHLLIQSLLAFCLCNELLFLCLGRLERLLLELLLTMSMDLPTQLTVVPPMFKLLLPPRQTDPL